MSRNLVWGVLVAASPATAQSLGTFSWQLAPYCNVITVNVTQDVSECTRWTATKPSAAGRAAARRSPASPCSIPTAPWQSASPHHHHGGRHPGARRLGDQPGDARRHVARQRRRQRQAGRERQPSADSNGSVTTEKSADAAVDASKIADGAVGAIAVDAAQVQRRIQAGCLAGRLMTGVKTIVGIKRVDGQRNVRSQTLARADSPGFAPHTGSDFRAATVVDGRLPGPNAGLRLARVRGGRCRPGTSTGASGSSTSRTTCRSPTSKSPPSWRVDAVTWMMVPFGWTAEVDVPIGPSNHFEPGDPDRGQPTHFMPNRGFGIFSRSPTQGHPTQRATVVGAHGERRHPARAVASEPRLQHHAATGVRGGSGRQVQHPPILRFSETGTAIQNPTATLATAAERVATAGKAMRLDLWVEDDGLHASGSNAPVSESPRIVELVVNKYRGPGPVTVARDHEKLTTLKGGKAGEPYAGKASTTVTFELPGEYLLHVTANDRSGPGGGATGCCWTTSLVKVSVKEATTTIGR